MNFQTSGKSISCLAGRDGDRGEEELGCDDGVDRVGQAGPTVLEDVFARGCRELASGEAMNTVVEIGVEGA